LLYRFLSALLSIERGIALFGFATGIWCGAIFLKRKIMADKLFKRPIVWYLLIMALLFAGCTQEKESRLTGSSSFSEQSVLETMARIEQRVSELRGLETLQPVAKAFLTTDELRQRMAEDVLENYSEQEARDDVLLYRAFEFIESDSDIDLRSLFIDVQAEQVLGFYDADTEEMYVVKRTQEPTVFDLWTFSHEYTHVLQDQHFDLQALGFTDEEEDEGEDSEAQFAIRSLVEGDASLLMQQYAIQYFEMEDLQEIITQSEALDSSVLDSAPKIVRESLTFPYEAGLVFVMALFEEGGWSAVDTAYAEPPLSTEQILHPEQYPDDAPQMITLPPLTDTLGSGWRLVDEDVLGEFGLRQYLDVYLDSSDFEAAAEGWGGDRYAVYCREDESAFVLALHLAWDTPADAQEFLEAYAKFSENRFGSGPTRSEGGDDLLWLGDDALMLAHDGQDQTLILIAPDEDALEALEALFPGF
jgi:hypothetical protein